MTDTTDRERFCEDTGKLLLRLTLGGLMLFHGIAKLGGDLSFIEGLLTDRGLPAWLAYGVYVGEVVTPLLMILGLFTRLSAIVFAFNMLMAIGLAHGGEIFSLGEYGEWAIEVPMLYL